MRADAETAATEGGVIVSLTRKDAAATILTALVVFVLFAAHEGAALPA